MPPVTVKAKQRSVVVVDHIVLSLYILKHEDLSIMYDGLGYQKIITWLFQKPSG